MDGDVLLLSNHRKRDGDRSVGNVDAANQPANTVFLPFLALEGLLFSDFSFFHGNNRCSEDTLAVIRKFPANKNAVARLDILQLDRRGFLEVFLPRRNSNESGHLLDQNGHVVACVSGQRNEIPGNGLDRAHRPCRGRSLSGRRLPRLRLGTVSERRRSSAQADAK